MLEETLKSLLKERETIERNGIHVAKEIADKTVWDELAISNPTDAVISAKNEEDATRKSEAQIVDIKQYLRPEDILLDLGSGYGRVAKYLLPTTKLRGFIGVDSSHEMLSLFKQRYDSTEEEQQTPVLLLNADIHTLPLKDKSVDMVIVCAVFLHNHKSIIQNAMTEVSRVVRPGGTVLVYSSFPRAASLMGLQGLAYQALLNLLGRPFKNGPVRFYWRKEVEQLFADFAEVKIKPVGYSFFPKTIIGLPGPLEKIYRLGFANPINHLLERLTPAPLKPYFAVHYDVVAKR